jgi:DNA-binding MarR family transcriptional regulator
MKSKTIDDQVLKFHKQIVELIKKYQFRDRNHITCCGVSVSQCYILEALNTYGALTMNELAEKMYLSISTVTRVVEELVKKGYAQRTEDPADRRIRVIDSTHEGKEVYRQCWSNVFESEKAILLNFPKEQRDLLINFLTQLNQAVNSWQSCCNVEDHSA